MRPGIVRLALVLAAFVAADALRADTGAAADSARLDLRPKILQSVGISQRIGERIPLDAILQDEDARSVRLGDYFRGKPVVLVLAYYNCPMLCTQVFGGLVESLRAMSLEAARDYEVVAVSFDPRDKPSDAAAKRKPYVEAYGRPGSESGWHFLTGSQGSIDRLTKAVGFRYAFDERLGQFAHASAIYVLTPEGVLARYFFGIEYAPRDLRLALVEASSGRLGTPLDQVLLYCYHYDPAVGRYGAVVLNIVRVGGAAAVVILGTFLALMVRMERRRATGAPAKS
ncbi:MAG TPA: SCO family protein [Thermoanaerobaculia bacterium]